MGLARNCPETLRPIFDFHKSLRHVTINYETMRMVLEEKIANDELKDLDLGPPPKKKKFNSKSRGNPSSRKSGITNEDETSAPPENTRIDLIMVDPNLVKDNKLHQGGSASAQNHTMPCKPRESNSCPGFM